MVWDYFFLVRSSIIVSYYSYCCWNCCVAEPISVDYIRHRSTIKVCMWVIWHAEAMRHKWKQKLQLLVWHPWGVVRQSTAKPCLWHLRSQEYVIQLSHGNHPFRALSAIRKHFDGGWKKIFLEVQEEVRRENYCNQYIVLLSWKREIKCCSKLLASVAVKKKSV